MATRIKNVVRGRESSGLKLSYLEITKVNFTVNLISYLLMAIVAIGFILIVGFADALYIPGIVIGILMATIPFKWFNWLDKIGWNTPRVEARVKIAKKYVKSMKQSMKEYYKYI